MEEKQSIEEIKRELQEVKKELQEIKGFLFEMNKQINKNFKKTRSTVITWGN